MTRGRGKYRVEHVDERPRGWRVRTKLSGSHVLRVGFPPGPRRRGAGRLLEVLHPREENNPSCPVTARAKANPESLIVFGLGNPDRDKLRARLKSAQARFDAISQKQTELRRRLKPQHGEGYILTPEWSALEPESDAAYKALESAKRAMNPRRLSVPDKHQIKIAKDTLRMPDAMVGVMGGMTKAQAREVLRKHGVRFKENPRRASNYFSETIRKGSDGAVVWANTDAGPFHVTGYVNNMETIVGERGKYSTLERARKKARKWLEEHAKSKGGNPRRSRKNAVRMQIELDPSRHQYRASMKHPSGGSWLYAWGYTKKQAAAALRDEWRKARGKNPGGAWRVSTYQLVAGTGRPIRKATKVTAPDGREVKFLERMSKRAAIAQAKTHLGISSNPRRSRRRHNPVSETEQAVKLFEVFHGKDPVKIVDKHVSAAMRKDYTALGKLVAVGLDDAGYGEREIAGKWDKCNHISFAEDGVTLASSPDGRQLYAIGGNQNLNGCLAKFQGVDPEKDFIDLGEVVFVVYEARKVHDNFEPVEYVHKFGGHGNTRPGWFYDRLKKQIFFIGGEYFIDIETKISPGIEG